MHIYSPVNSAGAQKFLSIVGWAVFFFQKPFSKKLGTSLYFNFHEHHLSALTRRVIFVEKQWSEGGKLNFWKFFSTTFLNQNLLVDIICDASFLRKRVRLTPCVALGFFFAAYDVALSDTLGVKGSEKV